MRVDRIKWLVEEILDISNDDGITFEELQEIDTIVMGLEMDISSKYEDWRDMMMY